MTRCRRGDTPEDDTGLVGGGAFCACCGEKGRGESIDIQRGLAHSRAHVTPDPGTAARAVW